MLSKKIKKESVPSEDSEQITFINWMRSNHPEILIFHIPNGGYRHVSVAKQLKLLGVVKGIPDLFVPQFNLWIEMKKTKGGVVSKEQKEIMSHLDSIGHNTVVCRGYIEAIDAFKEYLNERT